MIGLTYSTGEMDTVELKAGITQAKYLESQPLHHSQSIIDKSDYHITFQYKLIPNYEFKELIFMMSTNIEVLQPQWLRKEISTSIKKTLEK